MKIIELYNAFVLKHENKTYILQKNPLSVLIDDFCNDLKDHGCPNFEFFNKDGMSPLFYNGKCVAFTCTYCNERELNKGSCILLNLYGLRIVNLITPLSGRGIMAIYEKRNTACEKHRKSN